MTFEVLSKEIKLLCLCSKLLSSISNVPTSALRMSPTSQHMYPETTNSNLPSPNSNLQLCECLPLRSTYILKRPTAIFCSANVSDFAALSPENSHLCLKPLIFCSNSQLPTPNFHLLARSANVSDFAALSPENSQLPSP